MIKDMENIEVFLSVLKKKREIFHKGLEIVTSRDDVIKYDMFARLHYYLTFNKSFFWVNNSCA